MRHFACRQGKISGCLTHSGPTIVFVNLILPRSVSRMPQHSQQTSWGSTPFSRSSAKLLAAINSRRDGTRTSRPSDLSNQIRLVLGTVTIITTECLIRMSSL